MQLKHDDIERLIIKNIEIISSIDIDNKKDSILEEDILNLVWLFFWSCFNSYY